MANELEIRKIPFLGTELIAARDKNNQIWAGVRWICQGVGLDKTKTNTQVEKIKEDRVLSKGYENFRIPTNGGTQETICLKLDYVPLWLAKINITPTIEQENPELADRLEQYQLHAKDILAAAFLPAVYDPGIQNPLNLTAAMIHDIATCDENRLPIVLELLENVGFRIPNAVAGKIWPKRTYEIKRTRKRQPELSNAISEARQEYGISVARICQLTGIGRTRMYSYLNGANPQGDRAEYVIDTIREEIRRIQEEKDANALIGWNAHRRA